METTPQNKQRSGTGSPGMACSPSSETPESDAINNIFKLAMSGHLSSALYSHACKLEIERAEAWTRNMVDDYKIKLLMSLCERAKSICMGDADAGGSDDWIADYEAFLLENA